MNILILGAGIMQIPAIEKAKELGLFTLCADGNCNAVGRKTCDKFYHIDIKDRESLLDIARTFQEKNGLDAVFTAGTDFSSSVAFISERLGLPGITYSAALNATDKVRMRTCFVEHGVPSPRFKEFSSDMDIDRLFDTITLPVVVKPADSMGARGVKCVNDREGLEQALKAAINYSRTGRAIVEDYIDGPEFSLDSLVIDGEVHVFGFADRIIKYPPYFIETGHTLPAQLDDSDRDEIIRVFKLGVKALGINNGVAKGDMKLSKRGAVVGEIAARLSGGFMSGWTYPYASSIDLTKKAIKLALGQEVSLDDTDMGYTSAERAIYSIPGVVKEIVLPEKKDKNIKEVFISKKSGDKVVFPQNNVEKCGNIIAVNSSRDKAIKSAESFVASSIIRLKSPEYHTDQFLFNEESRSAFDIDRSLIEGLDPDVEIEGKTIYISKISKIINSRKRDWFDRTVKQVLKMIQPFYNLEFVDDSNCGYEFYQALINGSVQGVLYYLDSLEI